MSDEETIKVKSGHEVSIALIQKDIQYMRESMTKIENTFILMDKNYAKTEELIKLEKIIGDMAKEWEKKLETKVDKTDFDPIKKILARINWLLIAAVITGAMALIIKVPTS